MPDLTPDTIATAAAGPASAAQDGRSATAHPIPDQLTAAAAAGTANAVAGTNRNGGPRSPFGLMRPARAVTEGA
jgi:hypothetical protein